jgi:hypothetical protein
MFSFESDAGLKDCGSLGYARDDKGEGGASIESGGWTEVAFHHLGWAERPMIPPVGMTIHLQGDGLTFGGRPSGPWRRGINSFAITLDRVQPWGPAGSVRLAPLPNAIGMPERATGRLRLPVPGSRGGETGHCSRQSP